MSQRYTTVDAPYDIRGEYTSDFYTDLGFGVIPGQRRVTGWGNNPDVSTGVPEDVWSGGGDYPWMTGATSLEIVSSSALDTSAGTGARTATIVGLDVNFLPITVSVTLNGITPVALSRQFYRINSATIVTAGTAQTNQGTVIIRDAGAGTTRAVIAPLKGIAHQSMYTVAAGKALQVTLFISSCVKFTGADRTYTVGSYIRGNGQAMFVPIELDINVQPFVLTLQPGFFLPEKTDMWLRVTAASSNNMNITAGWTGILRTITLI